jgi:hypothetical protein
MLGADDPDDQSLVLEGGDEQQPDPDEQRIHQDRQAEDEEHGPPVAELVADFTAGDQADDRPTHEYSTTDNGMSGVLYGLHLANGSA